MANILRRFLWAVFLHSNSHVIHCVLCMLGYDRPERWPSTLFAVCQRFNFFFPLQLPCHLDGTLTCWWGGDMPNKVRPKSAPYHWRCRWPISPFSILRTTVHSPSRPHHLLVYRASLALGPFSRFVQPIILNFSESFHRRTCPRTWEKVKLIR